MTNRFAPYSADKPVYEQSFYQSRVILRYTWSIASLDIVLGLVGGFAGLCWGLLLLVLGSYEAFKYENSLISSIFPTSAGGGEHGDQEILPSDEKEAKAQMLTTVAGRGKYFYNYHEFLWSGCLRSLCFRCCHKKDWFKRRMRRLERHEAASRKVCREMDVVNLIYVRRLS